MLEGKCCISITFGMVMVSVDHSVWLWLFDNYYDTNVYGKFGHVTDYF